MAVVRAYSSEILPRLVTISSGRVDCMSAPRGNRVAVRVLQLAQLGHAQWLFGNLYEAVVKVPDLLATRARGRVPAMSPTDPGSPMRYYAAPATAPAVVAAAVVGRSDRSSRPWLATCCGNQVVAI